MKYIITESKMNNIIEDLIKSSVININKKKFKFVDDIKVLKSDENTYHVIVNIDEKQAAELSAGWGFAWNSLTSEIKKITNDFLSNNFKIEISYRYENSIRTN
jgi:hypothetical protein